MKKKTKLRINCFYKVYGGQPHPAYIFAYDKNHKTYISLKFGTTKGRHMIEIHPIQNRYSHSFVRNRPYEGTRKDYGDKELLGMFLDARDQTVFDNIKIKKPDRSASARKRYKENSKK